MAQLIVTVEDKNLLPILQKAIGLLKGVTKVVVGKDTKDNLEDDRKIDVSARIDRLTGIAAGINDSDIAEDDKLAYILGK